MNQTKILGVLDVIDRHSRAMFTEIRDLVTDGSAAATPTGTFFNTADPAAQWTEISRLEGQTYSWPPEHGGNEEYDPFIVYGANGMTLALAQNIVPTWVKERERKQIWTFLVDEDGSHKRPISPFVATDDYNETGDLIAIIRGSGPKGRSMFGPSDQLPPPYDRLRVEILGDRIAGHYNKYAVVAHEDDADSMLQHGAAQIRMRGW